MTKGTVKWFDRKKGYGFITADSGEEVFVHFSSITGAGFKFLDDGEKVEFEMEKDGKGLKAKNVNRSKAVAG